MYGLNLKYFSRLSKRSNKFEKGKGGGTIRKIYEHTRCYQNHAIGVVHEELDIYIFFPIKFRVAFVYLHL